MIIQIWESREALDRFVQDVLGSAMRQAGDRGYPQTPEIAEIDLTVHP